MTTTIDTGLLVEIAAGKVAAGDKRLTVAREAGLVTKRGAKLTKVGAEALEAALNGDVPTVSVTVEAMEPTAFAALGRLERIERMKAEHAATKAWIDAGSKGTAPASPVTTAFALAAIDGGKGIKANGAGGGTGRSNFTPEALADVLVRIKALRAEGKGWPTIAKTFNETGVPTAKGGKWASSTVLGIAKRNGIPTRRDA